MKGFRQKLNRSKRTTLVGTDSNTPPPMSEPGAPASAAASVTGDSNINESPQAAAQRLVKTFCMSDVDEAGSEVALLPSIVEAAESSPQAAAECARFIRKFLYRDYWARPNFVYNAIMLMRILIENPGPTFTRNLDKKFVDAVREVLRGCQHPHIVHFLIETLQDLEAKGGFDEGLDRLIEMWQKEKAKNKPMYPQPQPPPPPPQQGRAGFWQRPQPNMWPPSPNGPILPRQERQERRNSSSATLPKPRELRKRLDEARTTAGVLADVVNTTAPAALLKHDLADDLSARCRRATSQVLEYLDARDPIPDNQEMAALLATHEAVQQTLYHYHRAVHEARKGLGVGETRRTEDGSVPAEMTPAGKGKANAPQSPGVGAAGPSSSYIAGGSNGYSNGLDSPGYDGGGPGDSTFGRNEDDDMMAAAIAASVAPGANARGGRHPQQFETGGPANGPENPFADNVQAESSRSSSRIRPVHGGSSAAAGSSSAAGNVAYVNSDNESDEEYLRIRRRNKAAAAAARNNVGEGSSSSAAAVGSSSAAGNAAYGDSDNESDREYVRNRRRNKAAAGSAYKNTGEGSSSAAAEATYEPPPGPPPSALPSGSATLGEPGTNVGSSSLALRAAAGPAVDAAAGSQYGGGPVFRY